MKDKGRVEVRVEEAEVKEGRGNKEGGVKSKKKKKKDMERRQGWDLVGHKAGGEGSRSRG